MAPTAKLDYRCSICTIVNKCECVDNGNVLDIDSSNEKFENIAKGQNVLNSALRSLRFNKSTSITESDDSEKVLRPIISLREVLEHDNYDDCWIVLYDRVYDVTQFLNQVIIIHLIAQCSFKWHFARITKRFLFFFLFEHLAPGWSWCYTWTRGSWCQCGIQWSF